MAEQRKKAGSRPDSKYGKSAGKKTDSQNGKTPAKRSDSQYGKAPAKRSDSQNGKTPAKRSDSQYGKAAGKKFTSQYEKSPRKKKESSEYGVNPEIAKKYSWGSKEDKSLKNEKRSSDKTNRNKYENRNEKNVGTFKGKPDRTGKSGFDKTAKKPADGSCPYAKSCGSCEYQGTSYEKQLAKKQDYVKEMVGKFGKVNPILGMKDPYHYRNKVHAVFDMNRGKVISGVYKSGTHDVVNIDECQIEDQKADAIIRDIRDLLRSFKIKTYDEDTGYGLLRHVLIRRGFTSGEIMVVLVLGSPVLPSKNNFVKALRKLHPEITTVVLNVNNKRTSMVLGDKEHAIYGKGFIEDTLCGCTFRISPKSFYQVNPIQTEILYNKAMEYAGLTGKERVVDAYCGIGTIGLIAASKAKEVIGVELNRDAVRDAVTNAKRNEIKNVSFYHKDAGEFMVEMAEYQNDPESKEQKVDVVFMDPPRAGSDEAFMSSVVKLSPKRVVYISCNQETLARDLEYFRKKGYLMKECTPVDMFPWTNHTESVCLLERK